MENPNYYAIIPADVRYADITPNAKLLYGEITALSNKCGYCYASNSYFSDLYNVSKNSINNWISELINCGFISREIKYGKDGKQVIARYLRIERMVQYPPQKNLEGTQEILDSSPKNLEEGTQEILDSSPKNFGYINNTLNNTINNTLNTPRGEISNKNNTTKILENKKVVSKPRVVAPNLPAGAQLPNKVKAKLLGLKLEPACIKAITEYCLYLMDSYSFKDTALCKRIDDICSKGRNCTSAIQAICNYNIDRNYKNLYLPYDLSSTVAQQVAISEQATEDDFVRDENGNIEEIW